MSNSDFDPMNNEDSRRQETGLFRYITPGNADPRGRSKVFFCAHPNDYSRCLDTLCADLFAHERNSTVVFCLSDPRRALSDEEQEYLLEALTDMKLVITPVTSDFLYLPNPARELIFPAAQRLHIPLLPVLMEDQLENDFNRLCGALHCLNRAVADDTAIPYSEKMKKILSSVIENDTTADKIRAAFHAYIFLSYRKKDRKQAKDIMRLIHKNDFCRDVAIWYDEYLLPGEDFNASIREALTKSDLFAMVITDHLKENPNYVMTEELPSATLSGKSILGIKSEDTDLDQLDAIYEGAKEKIANVGSVTDEAALSRQLSELLKNVSLSTQNNDPEHLYFIGLAYLGGVDVEKDSDRALHLIERAAKDDLPEAMEKLAHMYRYGEGVTPDPVKAQLWLEDLFRVNEELYCEGEKSQKELFDSGMELVAAYLEQFDYENAAQIWDAVSRYEPGEVKTIVQLSDRGGKIAAELDDISKEARMYLIGLSKLGKLPDSMDVVWASGLMYRKLAEIFMAFRDFDEAQKYLDEGLKAFDSVTADSYQDASPDSRNAFLRVYAQLLDSKAYTIRKGIGDYRNADDCITKSIDLLKAIAEETDEEADRKNLADSYLDAQAHYKEKLEFRTAKYYCKKAVELYQKIAEETGTPDARADYALALRNLSVYEKNAGHYEKAQAIYRQIALRYPNVTRFRQLSDFMEEVKSYQHQEEMPESIREKLQDDQRRSDGDHDEEESPQEIKGSTMLRPCPALDEKERQALQLIVGFVSLYTDGDEMKELVQRAHEHIIVDGKISEFDRNLIVSLAEYMGGSDEGCQALADKMKNAF